MQYLLEYYDIIIRILLLLFFLHKIIPRTTSRMTTKTDDTATAMVEVSEVSDIGVLTRVLVDVVIPVL